MTSKKFPEDSFREFLSLRHTLKIQSTRGKKQERRQAIYGLAVEKFGNKKVNLF